MKVLFYFFLCVSFFGKVPELSELRDSYIAANGNQERTLAFYESLSEVTKKDKTVLVAYKGASTIMQAKFAKGKDQKKDLFKEGALLLEYAVASEPNNIEIRVIRMSIQENVPKFLKYNKNISEDKEFITTHYSTLTNAGLKEFVKSFVMHSEGFTASEREAF
ncbi:hypothetical protein [Ulvibacter litoralis]|uniref:Uncharacterized protein n=1 Tax=Ulvibacter litoralis TaxID=227084 RepID=A0A1G7DTP6_9FLAO|nr:hypothetical protein [Ulvibacter litoralis]GHC42359.1 hypothetical protein GCM10008083_00520 [Ulvibacter litoralis]SDE54811.1 hypothetical protein SAMN05421855_1011161 [Ulvibacter litoralis]